MELNALTAISPVDGRYRKITEALNVYFSEFGLIRYRVQVEVEYFIALCELGLPQLPDPGTSSKEALRSIYINFSMADAIKIKDIEKTTNHDVKAVEYFIKEKLDGLKLSACSEFIHFGLTSQDINNTSIPLSLKDASAQVLFPSIREITEKITSLAIEWRDIPMLARTHGQPA